MEVLCRGNRKKLIEKNKKDNENAINHMENHNGNETVLKKSYTSLKEFIGQGCTCILKDCKKIHGYTDESISQFVKKIDKK